MVSFYKALERARGGEPKSAVLPDPAPRSGQPRFAREMQGLAARLQPLFEERPSLLLMIMGCGRGEGATTVTTEFARHLTSDGKRVLFCGSHPTAQSPDEADGVTPIQQAGPNLSLLDISALLRSDGDSAHKNEFRERIQGLRDQFDVVLIDSPPILFHASWAVLLRHVDGVILVIEAEKTRSAILRSTLRNIEEVGGHVIGIVFNKRKQYIPRVLYRLL